MIVNDGVNEMEEQLMAELQLETKDANIIIDPGLTTIIILDDDGTCRQLT